MVLALILVIFGEGNTATLFKYGFEGSNPWTGLAGIGQTAGGTLTATATWTTAGTIDAYGTNTSSGGVQLNVNSSAVTGAWTADLDSGVLSLGTTTTRGREFITLAFSLSASSAYPIRVKIESYTSSNVRTGGRETLIYPAAANFYQRYALDLDKMTASTTGDYDPATPKVRIIFELDSAVKGTGWPNATAHTLKVDNVNLSTPKYYVQPASAGGSDSDTGADEAHALATIQAAVNKTLNGDNIIAVMDGVNGDDYVGTNTNANLVDIRVAGVPDAWIVVKNYPGQAPAIKSVGWNCFSISNTATTCPAYVEIRGLIMRGQSYIDANGDRQLPSQYDSSIGQVAGATNASGIFIDGRNYSPKPRHFRFADNTVEYFPGGGLGSAGADRISYENNTVTNTCWWNVYGSSAISNLVSENTENTPGEYRFLMQGNVMFGTESMVPCKGTNNNYTDANGIIVDSCNATCTGRTLIQNNVAVNNGGGGFQVFKSNRVDIIHNTAYHNSACSRLAWGQFHVAQADDIRVMNNILVAHPNYSGDSAFNKAPVVGTPTNYFQQNNVFFGGENASPSGGTKSPNLTVDPKFISLSTDPEVADFHLRPTSPALDYAQVLGYRSTRDLAGTPRSVTGVTDSGAYEATPSVAYAPVFSPISGNYPSAQTITLSSDSGAGASIIYTTNGTTPTVSGTGTPINGTLYTGSFPISTASTVKAVSWKSDLATSAVSTAKYTFITSLPAVSTPSFYAYNDATNFVKATGTTNIYDSTQKIFYLVRTPRTFVRYTTDGSTPTTNFGTVAGKGGLSVTGKASLKILAYAPETGRPPGPVVSANFEIRGSLGNLSDGSAPETIGANKIRFVRFLNSKLNTVTRIFARVGATTGSYRAAIYSEDPLAPGAPKSLLSATSLVSGSTAGWKPFPLTTPVVLTVGSYYWLAIWSDNASATIYQDTTGGTVRELSSTFGATWPASPSTTAVSGAAASYKYAIYAMTDPTNLAPVVSAGPDQTLAANASASLSGTVPDDGVPLAPGTVSSLWTKTSGSGTVTFANAASPITTVTFSAPGTYVLRLTGSDALASAYDEITVTSGSGGGGPDPITPEGVLYRETFGNSGTTSVRFNTSTIGWQQYTGTSDTANVTDTSADGVYGGIGSGTGRPVDLNNNNAGTSASLTNGFVFNQNATRALDFTTEFPIDRDAYTLGVISWYAQISSITGINSQSAAVRIAGQWHVSTPANNLTATGNAANFNSTASLFSVDISTATWRTLTATPGSPFVVGASPVALPTGDFEAFGVYLAIGSLTTTRLDTFSITATPYVPPVLTPLETWRAANFTPAELANASLQATLWGHLADPDGDGLNNLLEYALGSDPRDPNPENVPTLGTDFFDALTLTFYRATSDVTYTVEATSDLVQWETIETNPGIVGTFVTVSDSIGASPRRFMRLRVTTVP